MKLCVFVSEKCLRNNAFDFTQLIIERRVGSVVGCSTLNRKVPGSTPTRKFVQVFSKSCELRPINVVGAYNFLVSPSGFGKVAKA